MSEMKRELTRLIWRSMIQHLPPTTGMGFESSANSHLCFCYSDKHKQRNPLPTRIPMMMWKFLFKSVQVCQCHHSEWVYNEHCPSSHSGGVQFCPERGRLMGPEKILAMHGERGFSNTYQNQVYTSPTKCVDQVLLSMCLWSPLKTSLPVLSWCPFGLPFSICCAARTWHIILNEQKGGFEKGEHVVFDNG